LPLQIVSLLDIMRKFDGWEFAELVHGLSKYKWVAHFRTRSGVDEDIDQRVLPDITVLVSRYLIRCREIKLPASVAVIRKRIMPLLGGIYGAPTWKQLGAELDVLWDAVGPELSQRRFAFIADAKVLPMDQMLENERDGEILENPWELAWERFPSAKEDIEEAVYCYSLERNTACVFHLMRVAEVGLRGLARRMKVTVKNKPLEWAEWQDILREMNKVPDALTQTMKRGPEKDEILEFYRGCIAQFYGFKDEYRNQVSHKRKSYNEHHAASALSNVLQFMQKLAAKIDEKGRKVRSPRKLKVSLEARKAKLTEIEKRQRELEAALKRGEL
jgi:hypothetical protein